MNANYFIIYIGQVFFIADSSKEKRCLNGISFFFHTPNEEKNWNHGSKIIKEEKMSKQPKKLTRDQKKLLSDEGYRAKEWMLLAEDQISYTFVHKETKKVMQMEK